MSQMNQVQRFGLVHNQQGFYGTQLTLENAEYVSGKLNDKSRRSFNTKAQVREVEIFPVDDGQVPTFDDFPPTDELEEERDEFKYLMEVL